jgi:hypothetical protein
MCGFQLAQLVKSLIVKEIEFESYRYQKPIGVLV